MSISFSSLAGVASDGGGAFVPVSGNLSTPSGSLTSALAGLTPTPASTGAVSSSSLSSLISQLSSPTSPGQTAQWKEDPRLTQQVADLMQRANQTDAEISAQASNAYEAQRLVADREIARQQTRSLAANGVLPTGGLASQYRAELQAPVYDRLNAQRAQTELDLRGQRDNVKQNVTGTLAGMDNNKNQFTLSQMAAQQNAEAQRQQLLAQAQYQQASLSQQAQLASQQLAADQARAQAQQATSQAELDYRRQSDAQSLAFQREQAQLQNQRFYSGQGGSSGAGSGNTFSTLGSGSVFGSDDATAMRNNYNNLWNGTPESTWGHSTYTGDGSAQSRNPTTSNTNAASSGGWGGGSATGGGGMAGGGSPQVQNPASNRDAFGMTQASFFNPTSSRDASQLTSSMFSW